jgi:succinate dehydrogenase/fumarate reductase flavoprotein subunit
VRILERIMIAELIKQDGKITGAVGIATDSWGLHVFRAKATVICTGASGLKPVGGWPIGDLTADGQVMAYKAGAAITGKEFEDFHSFVPRGIARQEDNSGDAPGPSPMVDAAGNKMGFGDSIDFAVHTGRAPLRRGKDEVLTNVALGMSVHTAEGVWPADENCSAGIPGLYAAGDSCGTMVTGALYSIGGSGTSNATVTGARAGTAAARYAGQAGKLTIDAQTVAHVKDAVRMPAERQGGFSPNWVTQVLKNTMMPYYILRIKHGDRLQAALTFVEFMRDNLAPQLFARDPHELRLAHETKNMITNAEMKLRASLYRTESRGAHYREDYPRRSDPDWLAWVILKEVDGKMTVSKKPVPQAWWPDLTLPYEKRYPARFPGE